jgi:hypothetical protein
MFNNVLRGKFVFAGATTGKYPPSPQRGGFQPMSFGGKNMKRRREKGRKWEKM